MSFSYQLYVTTNAAEIGESGSVDIEVTAKDAGADGNTPAGTICLMLEPMVGITSITNADRVTGGADTEDDESYRERIIEAERNSAANRLVI